jgi:hypothetical protein
VTTELLRKLDPLTVMIVAVVDPAVVPVGEMAVTVGAPMLTFWEFELCPPEELFTTTAAVTVGVSNDGSMLSTIEVPPAPKLLM